MGASILYNDMSKIVDKFGRFHCEFFAKKFRITTRHDVGRWHLVRVCLDCALREFWNGHFIVTTMLMGVSAVTNALLVYYVHQYDDYLTGGFVYAFVLNAVICAVTYGLLVQLRALLTAVETLKRPLTRVCHDTHLDSNGCADLIDRTTIEAAMWEMENWSVRPSPFQFSGPLQLTPKVIQAVLSLYAAAHAFILADVLSRIGTFDGIIDDNTAIRGADYQIDVS